MGGEITMREQRHPEYFTPFGTWIRSNLRSDLSITNIDYMIEDYKNQRIMLLEEKQYHGAYGEGQSKTFLVLDSIIKTGAEKFGYEYWDFYTASFTKSVPEDGVLLNNKLCSVQQFKDHCNFKKRFCEPLSWSDFDPSDEVSNRLANRVISGWKHASLL